MIEIALFDSLAGGASPLDGGALVAVVPVRSSTMFRYASALAGVASKGKEDSLSLEEVLGQQEKDGLPPCRLISPVILIMPQGGSSSNKEQWRMERDKYILLFPLTLNDGSVVPNPS